MENKELKAKLKPEPWNQGQIIDVLHLFAFCNYTEVKPHDIDVFLNLTATIRHQKKMTYNVMAIL